MFRLIKILCGLSITCVSYAQTNMSLPPPLSGEQLSHEDVYFSDQFAHPVQGPDGSIYFFISDKSRVQIWPSNDKPAIQEQIAGFRLPQIKGGWARYASASTPQGIWLIGQTIELMAVDGRRFKGGLQLPRNNPKTLVLQDGSVLVVGGYDGTADTLRIERVWLDENQIQVEELPSIPVERIGYGYSVILTGSGKVLFAGTEYRYSLLFDPVSQEWQKLDGMQHSRSYPALILLPDGHIWATGGQGRNKSETTSELWNPQTKTWSSGPDLPIPMVNHTAVLNEQRDTVLLAGGYFSTVLAWKMDHSGVFVAAQHSVQRNGAGVFPYSGKLVLAGGRYARRYGEGHGRHTPGILLIPYGLTANSKRHTVWPFIQHGALLENQGQLIAIGGLLRHNHNGSDEALGSRLVERIDIETGQVHTLPSLPIVVKSTQAAWIGNESILLNAENAITDKRVVQWLGTLNVQTGVLNPLPPPPNPTYVTSDGFHRRMQLVGAHEGVGWLIAEDGKVLKVTAHPPHYQPAPHLQRKRKDFRGRVLVDGRVIVAGGEAESELVASRPVGCDNCPVQYIGFGYLLPSQVYEVFNPQTSTWSSSVPSSVAGDSVAILADGRVVNVGKLAANQNSVLEISDTNGRVWRTLSLPPEYWLTLNKSNFLSTSYPLITYKTTG
jgi:hypothetical protein